MIRRPKESKIESFFVDEMTKAFGREPRKYKTRMHDPDRLCLFEGAEAVFVELKRPKGKPRPGQIREHARLRDLGFRVEVVDTKEEVLALIEKLKNEQYS